ncbi:MAG TPA: hypothetical protein VGR13_08360 [Actinomycetota bacterium]|nr:hypothetical protein [Actinomycetota bacterium]
MPSEADEQSVLKERVCTTLEVLAGMEGIYGGVIAGGRKIVFIVDSESPETLDVWLQELPLWALVDRVGVVPLVSFRTRLQYNRSERRET